MWHTLSKLFFYQPHMSLHFLNTCILLHIIWRSDWVCKSLWEGEHPVNSMFVLPIFSVYATQTAKPLQTPWDLLTTYQKPGCSTTWGNTQTGLILSWFLFFVKIQPSTPSQKLDLLPSSGKNRHYETYSTGPNGFIQPPPPTNNSTSSESKNNVKASQEISHIIPNWCPFSYIKKSTYCTIQGEEQMTCLLRNYATKITRKKRSWMCKPLNFQCCRIKNSNHEVNNNINNSPLKMQTTNEPNGPYTRDFIIS